MIRRATNTYTAPCSTWWRLRAGEAAVIDELFPLLYHELHALARRQRRQLAPQQTLSTTARLHGAYLKFAQRGGGLSPTTLDGFGDPSEVSCDELLALNDALDCLVRIVRRLVHLVEMRFFGSMRSEEAATALQVSERTVKRDWRKAKALLFDLMVEPAAP